jgi:hypothetical protein
MGSVTNPLQERGNIGGEGDPEAGAALDRLHDDVPAQSVEQVHQPPIVRGVSIYGFPVRAGHPRRAQTAQRQGFVPSDHHRCRNGAGDSDPLNLASRLQMPGLPPPAVQG